MEAPPGSWTTWTKTGSWQISLQCGLKYQMQDVWMMLFNSTWWRCEFVAHVQNVKKIKEENYWLEIHHGRKMDGDASFFVLYFSEFPTMQCFSDFVVTLIISFCLISRGFLREQSQVYFARSKQSTKSIADVKMLKWVRILKCFLLRTIVQVVCYLRPMASYNLV